MISKGVIRQGEYFDSVTLMLAAKKLGEEKGVIEASIVMGTGENKEILSGSGLLLDEFKNAKDSDLIIAVKAESEEAADATIEKTDEILKEIKEKKASSAKFMARSLDGAVNQLPGANMVIISVAGKYASAEARKALDKGLNAMLFSDNVPVEKEVELKKYAKEKGLLVMGPDCGTAIINGAPLGFANVVKRGDIGMVAASGTGAQEISCIISNEGGGLSQVIGTGGRDVKNEVGGIMVIEALKALENDPDTKVITLVSKPPSPETLEKITAIIKTFKKPVAGILIGGDPKKLEEAGAASASNLEEAAFMALALSRGDDPSSVKAKLAQRDEGLKEKAAQEKSDKSSSQKYIRGLFCGGTLCDEAQLIFKDTIGYVYSPAPLKEEFKLKDLWKSKENTVVDLGEDEFTVGRPHPMIDFSLRNKRIVEEAKDKETAVLLLDVVLGYGSNMSPGDELATPIKKAKEEAKALGNDLTVICSITGTDGDPQDKKKVKKQLEDAGAIVMPSNASACKLAGTVVANCCKS